MNELRVTTFDRHVDLISQLSPHGLVLDWGRRLELAARDYCGTATGKSRSGRHMCECQIAKDSRLGPHLAAQLKTLRLKRNAAAHEPTHLTPREAAAFASEAFDALGQLSRVL
jgi:hypothetical protein